MEERYECLRLHNQLCYPIYLCAKEITRRYAQLLDELDLTYTQYIVMMYFWEREQSNVKELGKTLLLDPSTLTPLLKKLEAKGYLTRVRSQADERNLIVSLTEAGRALQESALPIPQKLSACAGLEPEEAQTLCRLIRKTLMNVEREINNANHPCDQR